MQTQSARKHTLTSFSPIWRQINNSGSGGKTGEYFYLAYSWKLDLFKSLVVRTASAQRYSQTLWGVWMLALCLSRIVWRQSAGNHGWPVYLQRVFAVRRGQCQKHDSTSLWVTLGCAVAGRSANYREEWSYNLRRTEVKGRSLFYISVNFISLFIINLFIAWCQPNKTWRHL